MKWNEKEGGEEGGWGLHRPRGYCYPHYEPLEQRPTMTASKYSVCVRERDREGVTKIRKEKEKKILTKPTQVIFWVFCCVLERSDSLYVDFLQGRLL